MPTTLEKQWLLGADHYLEDNEYIPYPGDYLWISYYSPHVTTDHVAMVEGVSINEKGEYVVHVIEGNNPDRVQRATYLLTYGKIHGYGTPVRRANRVIRLYDGCNDILPIQAYLVQKGYLKRINSREFDARAVTALKAYQKAKKLKQTGTVDYATRTKMEADEDFLALMEKYNAQ